MGKKFVVSEKSGANGLLLVVTDKDILNKIFEEKKKQLDLTKEFYKGKEMDKEEVQKLFICARDLHLTGKDAVTLGIKLNFVDPKHILYVLGIPHAEVAVEG